MRLTLGALLLLTVILSRAYSMGEDLPATSISDLEKRIQTTVSQTAAAAADKTAIRNLNTLKMSLMAAINDDKAQLQKDAKNSSLSSASQRTISAGIMADQSELDALNDSLGTWSTGLPGTASSSAIVIGTPATSMPSTPDTGPSNSSPGITGCVLSAKQPTAGTNQSLTYTYLLACAPGTKPTVLKISLAPPLQAITDPDKPDTGTIFQGYSPPKSALNFTFSGNSSSRNIQFTVPKNATTSVATYYVSTDASADATKCMTESPPPFCSTGTIPFPAQGNVIADADAPATADLSRGNTLFTKASAGVMMAAATGSAPQSKLFLDFYLSAPIFWTSKPNFKEMNLPGCTANARSTAATQTNIDTPESMPSAEGASSPNQTGSAPPTKPTPECRFQMSQYRQNKQFRDPLDTRVWAYFHPQITSIPQSNIAVGTLLGNPAQEISQIVQTGNSTNPNVATLVQSLELEQGLELRLMKHGPAMPEPIGNPVTAKTTKSSVALFAFGSFGVGVPLTGQSSLSTIYINNAQLTKLYNIPTKSDGSQYANVALIENSLNRFYKNYYVGLRLKTFNYSMAPCFNHPSNYCPRVKNEFPGLFDVAWGQDQAINPWMLTGKGVIRIQGDYPLPFFPVMHLFGSVYLSLSRLGATQDNTVFQVAGGDVKITDATVYQVAVNPLPRDQYRIGVGLDLIEVIKRISKSKVTISAISPANKSLFAGGPAQPFVATVTGSPDTTIDWFVNDIPGGNSAVGTIDASGDYTPPSGTSSSPLLVTLKASAHVDPQQSSTTSITISPKSSDNGSQANAKPQQ